MPRLISLVLGFITAILCGSLFAANTQPTIQSFNKMPLSFTKNMGQWDDRVLFRANAGGAMMWFTKEGVTYQFTRHAAGHPRAGGDPASVGRTFLSGPGQAGMPILPGDRSEKDSVEQLVLTAKFVGANANPNPEIIAEGEMEYKCNYFIGNDPSKWHTDVPNYEAITLRDIYPGIDLKYSGEGNGQAAYEFLAAPGADIAQIKVEYDGAEETSIDADGRMIVQTKWGDMIAAIKTPTNGTPSGSCAWWTSSSTTSAQDLAHGDVRQARVSLGTSSIGLVYSTYLGGTGDDYGSGIAVDGGGNAYVTGSTMSSDFPTQNPYQQTLLGADDAFVTKLSSSGNNLIYSTYLGGGGDDWGYGIAVDGSGNAYMTGYTTSSNFPTSNPYQATYQGGTYDVFVTKLSSSGNNLIYSTYLGGAAEDEGYDIAVDVSGNAYVTGSTTSSNFPTESPYQATFQGGGEDAFVTKFSSSGNSLIYSTYLGGGSYDRGQGIAVDGSGYAYLTGYTASSNFPTESPYQATFQGGEDAFVTKFSNSGNTLVYSTYLGGGSVEWGYGIAVDGGGYAYVTGSTASSNFPTLDPYQAKNQGGYYGLDAFATKLSSSGNSLVYSTYLGGGDDEYGDGIAIDGSGNAYVTGQTESSNFPTLNPYQTAQSPSDVFVTKLSSTGNNLIYSTYFGGGSGDGGIGIAVDGSRNAYVTGWTVSSNFPTLNPYQSTYQGNGDTFVTKFSNFPAFVCGDANGDAAVDISDAVYLIAYIFSGGSAPSPLLAGDANCDSTVDISDAVYLIAYIFSGGAPPCAGCK